MGESDLKVGMAGSCVPSGSLVVTASVVKDVVAYNILASEGGECLKVTRFSELTAFHALLIKEVPTFGGRLPAKTLRTYTTPEFVEGRRQEIEVYFRMLVTDNATRNSKALVNFFPTSGRNVNVSSLSLAPSDVNASTLSIGPTGSDGSAPGDAGYPSNLDASLPAAGGTAVSLVAETEDGEGSDDDDDECDSTMTQAMKELMAKRRGELAAATKTQKEIENKLASEEEAVKAAEQNAQATATVEADCAERLRAHRVNLEGLDAEVTEKRQKAGDTELQQLELAKRLGEELTGASDTTKKAQAKFETARRARMEAAAQVRRECETATAKKLEVEAQNAAAIERHATMSAVVVLLQERAKARQAEVNSAERDREARQAVNQSAVAESSEAESNRRQAEAEATAITAAVASHIADAARRSRAHDVEVRRAEERAARASKLRDMRTRGLVLGDDRNALESAEKAANAAAEVLHHALEYAKKLRDETKAKDKEKLAAFETLQKTTGLKLKERERVAAGFATRVEETEAAMRKSSAAYATANAALKTVEEELATIQQRVQGPLAKVLPESAAVLEDAVKAIATIQKKGAADQVPLRNDEEAESQLLKRHRQTEEAMVQSLDEARLVISEAHEDAIDVSAQEDVPVVENQAAKSMGVLVKSAEARYADRERYAQSAADAYKDLIAETESASKELENLWPEPDDELGNLRRAALEARLRDMKEVVHEKEAASKAAADASAAAQEELRELESRQESARLGGKPIEKLVKEELNTVSTRENAHNDKKATVLAEASERRAAWTKEKETLEADLHRAQLQATVAEEGANIASGLVRKA